MKAGVPSTISYSDRFKDQGAVDYYESKEYGPESYSTFIWQLEQPALERIIVNFKQGRRAPLRLLDFACGTGRILSCVEKLVDVAEGIDISSNMVELARKKCTKARLQVGDILTNPGLLQERD